MSPSQIAPTSAAGIKVSNGEDESHIKKLRWQIEFYFGDSNLSKDRYLFSLLQKSTHKHPFNCVSIEELVKFKRV